MKSIIIVSGLLIGDFLVITSNGKDNLFHDGGLVSPGHCWVSNGLLESTILILRTIIDDCGLEDVLGLVSGSLMCLHI